MLFRFSIKRRFIYGIFDGATFIGQSRENSNQPYNMICSGISRKFYFPCQSDERAVYLFLHQASPQEKNFREKMLPQKNFSFKKAFFIIQSFKINQI